VGGKIGTDKRNIRARSKKGKKGTWGKQRFFANAKPGGDCVDPKDVMSTKSSKGESKVKKSGTQKKKGRGKTSDSSNHVRKVLTRGKKQKPSRKKLRKEKNPRKAKDETAKVDNDTCRKSFKKIFGERGNPKKAVVPKISW